MRLNTIPPPGSEWTRIKKRTLTIAAVFAVAMVATLIVGRFL